MAGGFTIYSIYRLTGEGRYFLLRTVQREYSNASQAEEDAAVAAEQHIRSQMLQRISTADFELVGEMQNYPIGDALYAPNGNMVLDIYYMETAFGHPWIILGTARSEEAFLSELEEDADLLRLEPIGKPVKIEVTFITGSDLL
ncbi:hypothetical protein OGH69_04040 [Flavobacterium sp. MFBS3-15]|uniref:hypothetical protein n=1 Tax=Flavobacterium sp. MFBS3-15 TaxID=2989816 RepID=UPI0022354E9F|nr:hypothetical protein [Flavobacterium sp. MFBS3-15]MCW4468126.1 hypothetical protein [Flavobacterium sp. MFBS3-15]